MRWPGFTGERLLVTSVSVKDTGVEATWLLWGRQPQSLHLPIQQSAMEQALCARLGDAGKTTGRWD